MCLNFIFPYLIRISHSLSMPWHQNVYLVVVSRISQEPTKGDCVGDAAQVDEEHSRNGLDVKAVQEVTEYPGRLTLDVQEQTTTESVEQNSLSQHNAKC